MNATAKGIIIAKQGKMRVHRSLERLRECLAVRGIQTSAGILTAFLTNQAITAAPVDLAGSILQNEIALPRARV